MKGIVFHVWGISAGPAWEGTPGDPLQFANLDVCDHRPAAARLRIVKLFTSWALVCIPAPELQGHSVSQNSGFQSSSDSCRAKTSCSGVKNGMTSPRIPGFLTHVAFSWSHAPPRSHTSHVYPHTKRPLIFLTNVYKIRKQYAAIQRQVRVQGHTGVFVTNNKCECPLRPSGDYPGKYKGTESWSKVTIHHKAHF